MGQHSVRCALCTSDASNCEIFVSRRSYGSPCPPWIWNHGHWKIPVHSVFWVFFLPLWSRQQQQTKNRRIKRTRVPHSNTGNRRLKSRRVCAVVEGPRSWELPKRGGCYSDAQAPSSDGSMFVPPEKKKKRVLVAGVLLRHSNCSMIQNRRHIPLY